MTRRRLFVAPFLAQPCFAQYEDSRLGDTPWVPTPDKVIATMLGLAQVTTKDTVYDLGCGDGRIVIAAARDFGDRGVGIDIEPERILEANEAARQAKVARRVRFLLQDLHQAKISSATVVTIYLFTKVMARLKPKLLAELKPGTRIVAYQFNGLGDWQPEEVVRTHDHPVYRWTVPRAASSR